MPVFFILLVVCIAGISLLLFGIVKKQTHYIIAGTITLLLAILPILLVLLTATAGTM